jgi:hypothetical protein
MTTTRNRMGRSSAGLSLAALLLLGATACSEGGAGVTDDEFGELETTVTDLEERVGVLEEEAG